MGFASGNAESQPQRYAYLKNTEQLAVEQEFSGGIFTPFRAIGHWLLGKGKRCQRSTRQNWDQPSAEKNS
ncbi:lipid II-degrading bacteriocin [Pseudomonas alvandae]|uniref:lipid II-degrading bacteriocin n=1 Tax=Pseudomonas canavaninivorans TaxID=2842348 RepID=UPI002161097E|nr:lipid II-degrading bacteriocin [Pseudomonas canavaninivorans]UVM74799.1 lipid II-degrading bacteriocin [Pseudomonas canavaninivorans]